MSHYLNTERRKQTKLFSLWHNSTVNGQRKIQVTPIVLSPGWCCWFQGMAHVGAMWFDGVPTK